MNNQIINNLYEFWREIGRLTNKQTETAYYSVVSMDDSDWPNRIFDLKNNNDIIIEILKLSQEEKLPEIITITKRNDLRGKLDFEFLFRQKNMALDLKTITNANYFNNVKLLSVNAYDKIASITSNKLLQNVLANVGVVY